MNLNELNQKLDNIKLEKETKEALFDVIEYRINTDMEKLIGAIDKLDHKLETSIGSLNTKLETSIGSLRSEMGYIKWFIAGSIGLVAVISRFFN